MRGKILIWEVLGFVFISLVGSLLHFAFELSNFWAPLAVIAAVNESTWEHLKLVFWPGLIFALIEYPFLKGAAQNFWPAKAISLFSMPLIIAVGWYVAIAILGENVFAINIVLFLLAVFVGQWASYRLMTAGPRAALNPRLAVWGILLMATAFGLFTFFPPKIFLFEHLDLVNTGEYGILDNYEDLLIFRR
jgi:hypothetical protein